MSRDLWFPLGMTVVLTIVGEALAVGMGKNLFPVAAAEEVAIVDEAFQTLTILAIPVFAVVFTFLVYSVLRFRRRGQAQEDGSPIHVHRPLVGAWLLVTTALAVTVMIFPGATGLAKVRSAANLPPDLVVRVEGMQWGWKVTYPDKGVSTSQELVLPVGRRVKVEVISKDVVHSFWVPAFRVKIDAVPGMVTTVSFTPSRVGSYQEDPGFRVQCAELCGTGHTVMVIPVRVVEQEEFERWLVAQSRRT